MGKDEQLPIEAYAPSAMPSTLPDSSMTDYLRTAQAGFNKTPFTPVDSLILSTLSYLDFDRYPYGDVHGASFIPMIDILRFTPLESMLSSGWMKKANELPDFLDALARSRRFADLCVGFFANESADAIEKQFCACTFRVGDKDEAPIAYLAFRGTDGSLAGWKEDFNLSYMPTLPSQKTATAYMSGVLSALPINMPVNVGGHSKGGNLAEFAALTIDEGGYKRIHRIFNHDGPSFLDAPSPRIHTTEFKAKPDKTVPESSIFGMILENRDDFRIVKSDARGFFQHIPFTWVVEGSDFATQAGLNSSAKMIDTTLDRWLRSCSQQEREVFIDTIYELLTSEDVKSWADFQDGFVSNMAAFMRDGRNLDDSTKEIMGQIIRNLGGIAGATLRERLGAAAQRMRKAAPFTNNDNA